MSTDATSDASDAGGNDASDAGVNDASDAGGNDAADAADSGDAPPSYVITEIDVPTANAGPIGIVASPDGTIWFTELNADNIGRIDPSTNTTTEIPDNDAGGSYGPDGIANGPFGLFFTEVYGNSIVSLSTAGVLGSRYIVAQQAEGPSCLTTGPDNAIWFCEASGAARMTTEDYVAPHPPVNFSFPTDSASGVGVASGPDGNLWFTEQNGPGIVKIALDGGGGTEYALGNGAEPEGITAGPDGALWFTEVQASQIGRITIDGGITLYNTKTGGAGPNKITAGPDGALWFTENAASQIGRITIDGGVTEIATPTPDSQPGAITTSPSGVLWFTEYSANKIGRLVP